MKIGTRILAINLEIMPSAEAIAVLIKMGGIATVNTMPTMPNIQDTPNKKNVPIKNA